MWRRFTNSGNRQDRRWFLRQVVDGYLIERTSQLVAAGVKALDSALDDLAAITAAPAGH